MCPGDDSPSGEAEPPRRNVRIIIADDERDSLLTLGVLLRSEGYEVRLVRHGNDVPRAVAEFQPDAVLLDIGMPDRSGHDVAEELRQRYGEACPVLIAVTAHSTPADLAMTKSSGFKHHVGKPYDPQALLKLLASLSTKH